MNKNIFKFQVHISVPLIPTISDQDDIEFLRRNSSPWAVVETKWKSTSKIRLNDFKCMIKLENVTSKYPILKNLEINHILVRIIFSLNKFLKYFYLKILF